MTGGVAGSAINAVSYPFLMSIYTPYQFGVYAIFFIPVTLLIIISSIRLELVVVSSKDEKSNDVISSAVVYALYSTALLFPLSITFYSYQDVGSSIYLAVVASLYSLSFVYAQIFVSGFAVKNQPSKSAALIFSQSSSLSVSQLVLGYLYPCDTALINGVLASAMVNFIAIMLITRKEFNITPKWLTFYDVIIDNKNVIAFSSLQGVANSVSLSVVTLTIARMYGEASAGLFNICYKIILIPGRIMMTAIRQVLTAHIVERSYSDQKAITLNAMFITAVLSISAYITMLVLIDIGLVSSFLTNNDWGDIGNLLNQVSIWVFSLLLLTSSTCLLTIYRLSHVHFAFEFGNLLVRLICVMIVPVALHSVSEYLYVISLATLVLALITIMYTYGKVNEINKTISN
ncbi:oligosaccharide flippase family protein [Vibrio vulnificus]|nr:oligosaccharide flippase family protein [Vibrio vulnificus]EKA6052223.1 oligosaccharide flippase family protein [Vibrio vulnificus]ELB7645890.1 oligosaccharide flippase family protein [Vibrio vulnificus]